MALRLPPSTYTRTETKAAPRKAHHTNSLSEVAPKKLMAETTAAAAPALTPRMPGSASGLRVSACITAPDRPSPSPTISPSRVRGMRRSRTTTSLGVPA